MKKVQRLIRPSFTFCRRRGNRGTADSDSPAAVLVEVGTEYIVSLFSQAAFRRSKDSSFPLHHCGFAHSREVFVLKVPTGHCTPYTSSRLGRSPQRRVDICTSANIVASTL